MNFENIISHWNMEAPYYNEYEQLAIELFKGLSKEKKSDWLYLNLMTEESSNYYWFSCKQTCIIYLVHLIINGFTDEINYEECTHELRTNQFIQINYNINESYNKPNGKSTKINNKYYSILACVHEIINIDNPQSSRRLRYNRRALIKKINNAFEERNKIMKAMEERQRFLEMVSGSEIRNYMLDDGIIDYLKMYWKETPDYDKFTKKLFAGGNNFEEYIINEIKKFHCVTKKIAEHYNCRKPEKFQETIEQMKKGVPIIYQGLLHNYDDKTFGLPDLLVRSDYINTLYGYDVITKEEENIGSPLLGTPWSYYVIDIKHSTIPLAKDGFTVTNATSMMPYKGQIYIYTQALNRIQGTFINKGFIMGKKYEWINGKHTNPFTKLGVVEYDMELKNKVKDACKWIRDVRKYGKDWVLGPIPSRPELYPNLKNKMDAPWGEIKKEIADNLHEITLIWHCSVEHRKILHSKGIFKWSDPRCTAENMGFSDTKTSRIIDKILDINRSENDKILPKKVIFEREKWLHPNINTLELFLDYETIIKDTRPYIFMTGIGYMENNIWKYKDFTLPELTDVCESTVQNEFINYILNLIDSHKKNKVIFYHWSHAETVSLDKYIKKSQENANEFNRLKYSFYDLNKVFINEPIVINGAFNYSLKTIIKALYNMGHINTTWPESICGDGLQALVLAEDLYEEKRIFPNMNILENDIMKEIIEYNQIDCKGIWELLRYMRKNL